MMKKKRKTLFCRCVECRRWRQRAIASSACRERLCALLWPCRTPHTSVVALLDGVLDCCLSAEGDMVLPLRALADRQQGVLPIDIALKPHPLTGAEKLRASTTWPDQDTKHSPPR